MKLVHFIVLILSFTRSTLLVNVPKKILIFLGLPCYTNDGQNTYIWYIPCNITKYIAQITYTSYTTALWFI